MSKKEKLDVLKKDLYKKLCELIEDENEIEFVESEIFKDKKQDRHKETTRRGMVRAVTEDFFSKLIKIAEAEKKIEENEK